MVVDKFGRGLERHYYKRNFTIAFPDHHDLQNKRLARVGAPVDDNDAITKSYLDTVLDSFPTKEDLEKVEKIIKTVSAFFDFDNKHIVRLNDPTAGFHAVTKSYVDNKDKVTKSQIRAECEKVKREAMAEGDKKRTAIRDDLLSHIRSNTTEIENLRNKIHDIETKQRINTVYTDALYHHLNINKATVSTHHVDQTANHQ